MIFVFSSSMNYYGRVESDYIKGIWIVIESYYFFGNSQL